jgi:hypothetical protein
MSIENLQHTSPLVDTPDFRDLGRPLDPKWLDDFESSFLDTTQNQINFIKRPASGIVYALRREVVRAFYNKTLGDVSDTNEVAEILIYDKHIDEAMVLKGLTLTIKEFSLKPLKDNKFTDIRAVVGDIKSSSPAGYVVTEEKEATQRMLETQRSKRNPHKEPRHSITIGSFDSSQGVISEDQIKFLYRSTKPELEFGPVGEVRAFTDYDHTTTIKPQ